MLTLQQALQETGIAQLEYDGYTAVVRDEEGEFGDKLLLSIQKEAMPPHFSQHYDFFSDVEEEVKKKFPEPLEWEVVEPEG